MDFVELDPRQLRVIHEAAIEVQMHRQRLMGDKPNQQRAINDIFEFFQDYHTDLFIMTCFYGASDEPMEVSVGAYNDFIDAITFLLVGSIELLPDDQEVSDEEVTAEDFHDLVPKLRKAANKGCKYLLSPNHYNVIRDFMNLVEKNWD